MFKSSFFSWILSNSLSVALIVGASSVAHSLNGNPADLVGASSAAPSRQGPPGVMVVTRDSRDQGAAGSGSTANSPLPEPELGKISEAQIAAIRAIENPILVIGGGVTVPDAKRGRFSGERYVIMDREHKGTAPWLKLDFNNLKHLKILSKAFAGCFSSVCFDHLVVHHIHWGAKAIASLREFQNILNQDGRFYFPVINKKKTFRQNKDPLSGAKYISSFTRVSRELTQHLLELERLASVEDQSYEKLKNKLVNYFLRGAENTFGVKLLQICRYQVNIGYTNFPRTADEISNSNSERDFSPIVCALREVNKRMETEYVKAAGSVFGRIFQGVRLHDGAKGDVPEYPDLQDESRNQDMHNCLYWICGQNYQEVLPTEFVPLREDTTSKMSDANKKSTVCFVGKNREKHTGPSDTTLKPAVVTTTTTVAARLEGLPTDWTWEGYLNANPGLANLFPRKENEGKSIIEILLHHYLHWGRKGGLEYKVSDDGASGVSAPIHEDACPLGEIRAAHRTQLPTNWTAQGYLNQNPTLNNLFVRSRPKGWTDADVLANHYIKWGQGSGLKYHPIT